MPTKHNMNYSNSLAMSFGVVFLVFAICMFIANSYLDTDLIAGKLSTMTLGIIFFVIGVITLFVSYPKR